MCQVLALQGGFNIFSRLRKERKTPGPSCTVARRVPGLVFFTLMLLAIAGAIFYGITKHFLLRYRSRTLWRSRKLLHCCWNKCRVLCIRGIALYDVCCFQWRIWPHCPFYLASGNNSASSCAIKKHLRSKICWSGGQPSRFWQTRWQDMARWVSRFISIYSCFKMSVTRISKTIWMPKQAPFHVAKRCQARNALRWQLAAWLGC